MTEEEKIALQNLSNAVHLVTEDERYQFVYGTHLYGSSFSLFANFDVVEKGSNMKINHINFIGVNYKGPVGLDIYRIDKPKVKDGFLEIQVNLRAGIAQAHTPIVPVEVNEEVHFSTILQVARELVPLSDDYENCDASTEKRAFKNGIFDSEFFVRDGLFIDERTADWNILQPKDQIHVEGGGWPGSNCKFGFSELRF